LSVVEKNRTIKSQFEPVRVAIAQSAPVYLDKRASLAKALDLIQRAAKRDARLVAFGGNLAGGLPCVAGCVSRARHCGKTLPRKTSSQGFRRNSLVVPGEEVNALSEAARDLKNCDCDRSE